MKKKQRKKNMQIKFFNLSVVEGGGVGLNFEGISVKCFLSTWHSVLTVILN